MFDRLRSFFGNRPAPASVSVLRLGTSSPVGFHLPPGLIHRAISGIESALGLSEDAYPIELRMSFLRDYTKELTTPELEAECLMRMRPEAEAFLFGRNPAIGESTEAQEARGLVVYLHHTISARGLICTATLEMLPKQVPPQALHQFRDALPKIFGSLQPIAAQINAT